MDRATIGYDDLLYDGATFGVASRVAMASAGAGEGAALQTWATVVLTLTDVQPLAPSLVAAAAADQAGLTMGTADLDGRRILSVWDPAGHPLQVTSPEAIDFVTHGGSAWIRLVPGGRYRIRRPDGSGVVVGDLGQTVIEVRPCLQELSCPATAWLDATAPAWLRAEVAGLTALGNPYAAAVAVGLVQRHVDAAGPEEAIARLLAGDADASPADLWMQDLGDAALSRIEDLALARVTSLETDFEQADRGLDLDAETWQEAWIDLCHGRDALWGVCGLLRARGRGQAVDAAADDFDARVRTFVAALPRVPRLQDPWLASVAVRDPSRWWGEFSDPAAGQA